jgi:hypothetical protein
MEKAGNIKDFVLACKEKEEEVRQSYGDQVFQSKLLQPRQSAVEYWDQLSSYERTLMGKDGNKLLERLRSEDMAQTARLSRGHG